MSTTKSWLSSDRMLGIAGSGIAAGSVAFGVYMTMHGPAPGGLGHSGDFTVFAQLAPRQRPEALPRAARPATTDDALDTSSTASIRPATAKTTGGETADDAVIPSMTLEDAAPDVATIAIGGRIQTVRIGDDLPGAGEVLEIRTGAHPAVRTSRGLIVSARQD